jgi:hypothetical protein
VLALLSARLERAGLSMPAPSPLHTVAPGGAEQV